GAGPGPVLAHGALVDALGPLVLARADPQAHLGEQAAEAARRGLLVLLVREERLAHLAPRARRLAPPRVRRRRCVVRAAGSGGRPGGRDRGRDAVDGAGHRVERAGGAV